MSRTLDVLLLSLNGSDGLRVVGILLLDGGLDSLNFLLQRQQQLLLLLERRVELNELVVDGAALCLALLNDFSVLLNHMKNVPSPSKEGGRGYKHGRRSSITVASG